MRYKPDILLRLLLLVFSLPIAAQQTDESLLRDSVYRHAIQYGSDSLNCYLTYRPGNYEVIRSFEHNDAELAYLDAFIRRSFADTLVYVRSVHLTGYCSIEGPYIMNEQLANNRVSGMKKYLDREYGLSSRCPVRQDYVAEDWEMLRQMIAVSDYPWRDEAISIIDGVGIFEGRESLLMKLDDGNPYREMGERFFPKLRRVEVTVEYDLKRIIEQRYQRKMDDAEFQLVLKQEREKAISTEERIKRLQAEIDAQQRYESERWNRQREQQEINTFRWTMKEAERERSRMLRREFRPLVSIKTNLMGWAGLTPELERTTFMPNLAAEVFFANRWSVEVSGMYADFDFGSGEHWGVASYRVEPRFWLKDGHCYKGFYFGLYGQMGDFNSQRTTDNHTGTYLQGGLSVGYYWLLTKRWGIGTGVRGGYQQTEAKAYELREGCRYDTEEKVDANRMGLMGIDVNVNYRF